MKQENIIQLEMLQQEAERLNQENEAVNRQLFELNELKKNLLEFLETKEKDALISLGKGIYTKAELKDKGLYVNIGAGIVVKKRVPDTIRIIDEQAGKLENAKEIILQEIEKLKEQANSLSEE